MLNEMEIHNDLAFLTKIGGERYDQYRQAEWLHSPFEAEVWECYFGDSYSLKIDFRVKLDNDDLLTNPKHLGLLEIFKCWLCVQTHFDATGGQVLNSKSEYDRIIRTLHIIDYFLLHAIKLQISKFGLEAITENDFIGLFLNLASSNTVANTIYDWPGRLSTFFKKRIKQLSLDDAKTVADSFPFLSKDIPPEDNHTLNLTQAEIINVRIWLWSNGFYKPATRSDYRFSPNTERLAKLIFSNTLRGKTPKPIPDELLIERIESFSREYPAVPVRTNEADQLSEQKFNTYLSVVRRLGLLAEIKLAVPLSALKSLNTKDMYHSLNLKTTGRFKTLPQQIVLQSLRNAVEFSLEYGDDLIESYLSLAKTATSVGRTCMKYSNDFPIGNLMTQKIRSLGVEKWTLDNMDANFHKDYLYFDRYQYFQALRSNLGLWELLRVFYGAVQICVGTLMARRSGEITDLMAGHCVDISGSKLIFYNRKSGIVGKREKEARPIPKIAVNMIRQLEKLQSGLVKIGLLEHKTNLFSFPSQSSKSLITGLNHTRLSESIDFFCDYFQTPTNKEGQRYYIRQHQLRRFFAMLFFWGKSFGGMDTLRWFLGHTDVQHLYHYITESTPGEVLRSVKAHYAGEMVINASEEVESLSELINQHFGTKEFSVLDSDELDEYIEDLMIEGRVEIEPEFFETPDGQSYRVLVKVRAVGKI